MRVRANVILIKFVGRKLSALLGMKHEQLDSKRDLLDAHCKLVKMLRCSNDFYYISLVRA